MGSQNVVVFILWGSSISKAIIFKIWTELGFHFVYFCLWRKCLFSGQHSQLLRVIKVITSHPLGIMNIKNHIVLTENISLVPVVIMTGEMEEVR